MPQPRILAELHLDHQRFARILGALEKVELVDRSDALAIERLGAMIDYLSEYPEAIHHPLEDRVFERLLIKPLSADDRATVRQNAQQHEELTRVTQQLGSVFDESIAADIWAPDELLRQAKAYAKAQYEHMNFEEEAVFPLAERAFTAADWQAIETTEQASHDPLFDQQLTRFESLYDFVATDDKPRFSRLRQPTIPEAVPTDPAGWGYLAARAFAETTGNWAQLAGQLQQLGQQRTTDWLADLDAVRTDLDNAESPMGVHATFWSRQVERHWQTHRAAVDAWTATVERNALVTRRFLATAAGQRAGSSGSSRNSRSSGN